MNSDDLAELIVKDNAIRSLIDSYKVYGIEGTEDKIKELYKNSLGIMNYLLNTHRTILQKGR